MQVSPRRFQRKSVRRCLVPERERMEDQGPSPALSHRFHYQFFHRFLRARVESQLVDTHFQRVIAPRHQWTPEAMLPDPIQLS